MHVAHFGGRREERSLDSSLDATENGAPKATEKAKPLPGRLPR